MENSGRWVQKCVWLEIWQTIIIGVGGRWEEVGGEVRRRGSKRGEGRKEKVAEQELGREGWRGRN